MSISRTELAESYERLAEMLRRSDELMHQQYIASVALGPINRFNELHGFNEGDAYYFDPSSMSEEEADIKDERRELDEKIDRFYYSLGIWRCGDFVDSATKECACPKCASETEDN